MSRKRLFYVLDIEGCFLMYEDSKFKFYLLRMIFTISPARRGTESILEMMKPERVHV